MMNVDDVRGLVQQAIDAGATSVEEVHQKIAAGEGSGLDSSAGFRDLYGQIEHPGFDILPNCHVVGFAARDIHFQFDPAQIVPVFITPDLYER